MLIEMFCLTPIQVDLPRKSGSSQGKTETQIVWIGNYNTDVNYHLALSTELIL